MTDLVNDLKAAKALIDTPRKRRYMPFGVQGAIDDVASLEGGGVTRNYRRYEAIRAALLTASGLGNLPALNRLPHADIMSLFDRAIAAAEARS